MIKTIASKFFLQSLHMREEKNVKVPHIFSKNSMHISSTIPP